jgi:hypothetical protein
MAACGVRPADKKQTPEGPGGGAGRPENEPRRGEADVIAAGRAARAAIAGATPLPGNDHKVPILEAVLARTILAAAAAKPAGAAGAVAGSKP